ncbi:MAG: MFS transporter [Hyphomicrobiales bacterium]|nr:MFS transporter [Hyphomicrobiales bacterium]
MEINELKKLSKELGLNKENIAYFLKNYNNEYFEYIIKEIINVSKNKAISIKSNLLIGHILETFSQSSLTIEEHVEEKLKDEWLYKKYPDEFISKDKERDLSDYQPSDKTLVTLLEKQITEIKQEFHPIKNQLKEIDSVINEKYDDDITNIKCNHEENKKSIRFGFYCLLTILSMVFYIIGGLAFLFFDSIVYPKLHAYLASIIIPCVILGIAIGVMYRPIFNKIFRKNRANG